mmetsp:Transcript_15180/g.41995  ORF Transcript_15180/g.41995 Transcript_15180/m.41995 type:complete len:225 (-) Transcript_15180:801-1475(-)
MVKKLASRIRIKAFLKLRSWAASSRLRPHWLKIPFQTSEFIFQLRLLFRSMLPTNKIPSGEFPHPFTTNFDWLNTAELLPPYGLLPEVESSSLTASCSDKMRTNTSCTLPFPSKAGTRVVISTLYGLSRNVGEKLFSKMNHFASSTLHTSSRQMRTFLSTSIRPRSSLIPSKSPPWKRRTLSARSTVRSIPDSDCIEAIDSPKPIFSPSLIEASMSCSLTMSCR